ncbi:MAG: hypothetical protein EGR51_00715, partial [Oscillibacter sp.]|nr:hypothetical protein [Oscillibacter sp.]
MPIWRKSEDPWDMEPEKRRTWTAGEPQPPAADGEAWKVPGEKETAEEQRENEIAQQKALEKYSELDTPFYLH